MEQKPRLSIVISVQGAQANLPEVISALQSARPGEVELLICNAQNDPVDAAFFEASFIRSVEGAIDALAPELWRDGILTATSDYVAILTAHCIPHPDWLKHALALDMSAHVAYGGPIVSREEQDAVGAAIHLLRYANVTPPQAAREISEVAADNAVYCRAEILSCADLLTLGFWEPAFHERFRQQDLTMAMAPSLVCGHLNRYKPGDFCRQRRLHGRAFGRARANEASTFKRIVMLMLAPVGFIIFGAKLTAVILEKPALRRDLLRALPWLTWFLANWSWGEGRGYADVLTRPHHT